VYQILAQLSSRDVINDRYACACRLCAWVFC